MKRKRVLCLTVAVVGLTSSGCNSTPGLFESQTAATTGPTGSPRTSAASRGKSVLPLDRFTPDQGAANHCTNAFYHQFDFWIGSWDVRSPSDAAAGTNVITPAVDGCALLENWADVDGNRGRSLNVFDWTTRRWTQFWMQSNGLNLRLEGDKSGRSLSMAGAQPRAFGGPEFVDRITWTDVSPTLVRQYGDGSADGGATWEPAFDLNYHRKPTVTPAPEPAVNFCSSPARFRYHWFDFNIGAWDVHVGDASAPVVATSTVALDLQGCLHDETLVAPGGYNGRAFSAFNFLTRTWYRTFVDNDGVRVHLAGVLVDGRMVMSGSKVDAHGQKVDIQVKWEPIDANAVRQSWTFSTDGGGTWSEPYVLVMTRRP